MCVAVNGLLLFLWPNILNRDRTGTTPTKPSLVLTPLPPPLYNLPLPLCLKPSWPSVSSEPPPNRRSLATRLPTAKWRSYPAFVNEFWTAKQRQASSLHEVSYRACFKPQLPRFFIERLTQPGDVVYDPFMGRGTTPLEAALLGRVPFGCDINPLERRPDPPAPASAHASTQIAQRLAADRSSLRPPDVPEDLLVFYHPDTLRAISSPQAIPARTRDGQTPWIAVDDWIAWSRSTGSPATRPASSPSIPCRPTRRCRSSPSGRSTPSATKPRRLATCRPSFSRRRRNLAERRDHRRPPDSHAGWLKVAARTTLRSRTHTPQIPSRSVVAGGHLAAVPQRRALRHRQLAALLVPGHRRHVRQAHRAPASSTPGKRR